MNLKRIINLSFFAYSGLFLSLSSMTYITHGGFGKIGASWFKEGGDFFEEVKVQAQKIGHEIKSFSWDQPAGGIFHSEKIIGAVKLAQEIWDYKQKNPDKMVDIIAHSYGGIVSAGLVSQLLSTKQLYPNLNLIEYSRLALVKYELSNAIKNLEPFMNLLKHILPNQPHRNELYEQENLPENASQLESTTKHYSDYVKSLFNVERSGLNLTPPQGPIINRVFILGTPSFPFSPDMSIIHHLYIISSQDDWVDKLHPTTHFHETLGVVRLSIKSADGKSIGHANLHDKIVAQHILDFPTICQNKSGDIILPAEENNQKTTSFFDYFNRKKLFKFITMIRLFT